METRTRWTILWFLVFISVVRSMDAVNFSVAAKQIMPEYGFPMYRWGCCTPSSLLVMRCFISRRVVR